MIERGIKLPLEECKPDNLVWYWGRPEGDVNMAHLAPFGIPRGDGWYEEEPVEPFCGAPAYKRTDHEFWTTKSPWMDACAKDGLLCAECSMKLLSGIEGYMIFEVNA